MTATIACLGERPAANAFGLSSGTTYRRGIGMLAFAQSPPTMRYSLDAGTPQRISPNTVADGLAAPFAGEHTFAHVQRYVDRVVLVDDDAILAALRALLLQAKLAAEPAGAAALAALSSGAITLPKNSRVVCVVSGGNADPAVWQRALNRSA